MADIAQKWSVPVGMFLVLPAFPRTAGNPLLLLNLREARCYALFTA